MAKRVSLNDRESPEETKYSKAISAFITEKNDVNKNDDVDVNVYTNDDINVNDDVNVNVNINDDKNVNSNVNNFVNKNVNKIVINKKDKKLDPKRATYYLMPATIQKIERVSKATGIGKSTLVQQLLDMALDLVEVE